jgi:DNA-binding response OmpR family regulator
MTYLNNNVPRAAERILIVDDERRNRQLLEVMLGAEGYALESASAGEEALRIVAERPPDLVLLDIMMPGMNGYQVAATIKADAATRHVLVVMLSALDDRNSRAHGLNMGADAFLAKPVNRAEVCDLVRSLLAARPAATPGS